MILLDASVLIRYLRHRDPSLGGKLGDPSLAIRGVTRAEILHGARNEEDWQKLVVLLDQFRQVCISNDLWDKVGLRLFQFRLKGLIFPFQDVVLATVALEHDTELWSYDRHFQLMAGALPLRLYHWSNDQ